MFTRKFNNKNDLLLACNQFIKENVQLNAPYNFDKEYIVYIMTPEQYKSNRQNSLFHSLLQELWNCGVSSYDTYEDLRDHYKELAGLITYKKIVSFEVSEKSMIYKALKLLPLKKSTFDKLWRLLSGEIEVHHSWADVSKSSATFSINTLINDCSTLGAYACSSKIKTIIDELNNLDKILM